MNFVNNVFFFTFAQDFRVLTLENVSECMYNTSWMDLLLNVCIIFQVKASTQSLTISCVSKLLADNWTTTMSEVGNYVRS